MTDFYLRIPNDDLAEYTCDQTVISKKKYLKHLSRVIYEEDEQVILPQVIDWYAYTNSYYPYTEDVDAFARVNHLLSTKPSFESLTSIPNCESIYDEDSYSEKGAQLQYLSSKPISFLILGKPGIGEEELGKLLADYWNCVYIDPEILIHEEIASGSRAGQCIEFNLRCGRAIGVDVIIRLIEKRVRSRSAEHKGFVICGLPLIPNDLYEEDPVSSESAVFNVQEIFEELFEVTLEIGVPPPDIVVPRSSRLEEVPGEERLSEAPPSGRTVNLPPQDDVPLDIGSATASNICTPGDLEKNFEEQIDFIFNQFHRPYVVIYVACSNSDVVSKHKDYRFDYYSKQVVDLQREHSDKVVYTYFSTVPGANDELPSDFIDVIKNNTATFDTTIQRQLVHLPRDFPSNMVTLLDRYRYCALPVIERHILVHDNQYFIKVDGRISPIRMFSAVKTRLRILPLQPVIVPEKLLVPPEPGGEGGPAEDIDVEGLTFEECFELFRKKRIASPMFKWGWSEWGIKCPVSMREGGYDDGDPKFAVHFMNNIYFLKDKDAYIKFYRNPRPYLLPPYPKPSCKIFVIGPRCSGKTAVAKCLGFLLKGEVLDFNKLEKDFLKIKITEYEDTVRSAALNEGVAVLNRNRRLELEEREQERQAQVDTWLTRQMELLEDSIKLKQFITEEEENMTIILEMSSIPVRLTYNRTRRSLDVSGSDTCLSSEEVANVQRTVAELQQLISIEGLPGLGDMELCEGLLAEPEKLFDYLPPPLQPPETFDLEPANIFDDFVRQYAEEAVTNASYSGIELSSEYIAEMLIATLQEVEERSQEQGYNKGGWILDGLPPNQIIYEKLEGYLPDDIILLKDVEEYHFLLERFGTKGLNEFRDYRNFFMGLDKPDAAWRAPTCRSTDSYKAHMVGDFLDDVLDDSYYQAEQTTDLDVANQDDFRKHPKRAAIEAYTKELIQFDEDWDALYTILSENKRITIAEINVTNKSLTDLLEEVVKNIEDRYRQLASVFTADDRVQELEDFGEPDLQGEEMGEGEEKEPIEDLFFQNRRFGDTFNYCPVSFHNHWVLWNGKEEFTAKFENKLYLMCSEEAMNAFVENPRLYLLRSKPPSTFPPPRLCIVGPVGSGKSTVTKALCRNLGLYSADYLKMITKAIAPKTKFELTEILKMGIAGAQGEMIQNYIDSDEPLPPEFLNQFISPLWFTDPFRSFGFILDGFPMRPSDVEYMIQQSAIPDIVVELSISEGELNKRLTDKFIYNWEKSKEEKHVILEKKRREIMDAWEEKRNARFKELMEFRKEERYAQKIKEKVEVSASRQYLEEIAETDEEKEIVSARKSQISFDSVAEEADVEAVNIILNGEIPEPVLEEEPEEDFEEAIEKFATDFEESYNNYLNFFRHLRQQCELELIPWITVDAGMSEEKVFAQVMRVVDKYKFRNNALFERVYDISVELADKLLSKGYYFLSKFGKTCPVQLYENINPVQLFLPLEKQFQLFPVIHRQYIYFLAKRENREKFKDDPLKYTRKKNYSFPLIPLKLAIIGPPKSGKTALAERYGRDLGMKVISRGKAGRYVLKYLEFSELAKNMESVLRMGWELTSEMVIKSVEAMAYDGNSITQGFVLDGFPCCIDEVRHLAQLGLIPHLVIDLQAEHADMYEFIAGDTGKRGLPVFSKKFFDHRYEEWLKTEYEFREWLDKEYQIIAKVPVKPSKWGVWSASHELATAVFSEIKHYHRDCHCDVVLRLGNMQITPLEFLERRGGYKHYCPCCLHYDNALVSSGEPPDRTGVVQFRKYYYYLCPDHINEFVDDPEQFLSPYNNHKLPHYLPIRVYLSEMPDDVYEDGFCVVCYWENQPKLVLRKGILQYAVSYKEVIYIFDSLSCMNTFMRHPFKYCTRAINFKGKPYPSLNYYELPTLGLVQQYDSRQLVKAIVNTGILRPIIPGLSPETSASVNIGLFLKMNNPRTPEQFLPLYDAAQKQYHERRINLITYLAQMKKMINPYLYYDEPLPKFVDPLLKPSEVMEDDVEPDQTTARSTIGDSGSALAVSTNILDEILNKIESDDVEVE